jgi:hypothetical protein
MGDLVEYLSDLIGASQESAGWAIAILAILLITFGTIVLLVTIFGKWAHAIEQDPSTRLLPTLVEDVLDVDLQRVYRRTLMVDTQIAHSFEGLTEPTGTELGRQARQLLVGLQAQRFAACQQQPTPQRKDEPPEQEARLKEVSAVIERALDELPVGRSGATDPDAQMGAAEELAAEKLEELRAVMELLGS